MQTTDHPSSPTPIPPSSSRDHSMKIKRFVAADMRSAMNLVRKEHGPEAVILSNRRIEEGIEIVAAANYDESAVQRALEASRRDVAPPPAPRPRTAADAVIAAVTRRRSSTPAPEPVAATTSAVAALARAAVGATGRTLDSADEIVPTRGSTGFAATLARAAVNEPALPEQSYAPFAEAIVAPAATSATPANRARFQIDPPHEAHHESAAPAVQPPPLPTAAVTDAQPEIARSEPAAAEAAVDASPAPMLAPAPTLTVVAQDDAEIRQLRQEVAGMRQVIEREMNRFTDERLRGCPVRATALDLMDEYGFDAGLARDVAMQIPLETEAHRGRGLMLGLISRNADRPGRPAGRRRCDRPGRPHRRRQDHHHRQAGLALRREARAA